MSLPQPCPYPSRVPTPSVSPPAVSLPGHVPPRPCPSPAVSLPRCVPPLPCPPSPVPPPAASLPSHVPPQPCSPPAVSLPRRVPPQPCPSPVVLPPAISPPAMSPPAVLPPSRVPPQPCSSPSPREQPGQRGGNPLELGGLRDSSFPLKGLSPWNACVPVEPAAASQYKNSHGGPGCFSQTLSQKSNGGFQASPHSHHSGHLFPLTLRGELDLWADRGSPAHAPWLTRGPPAPNAANLSRGLRFTVSAQSHQF